MAIKGRIMGGEIGELMLVVIKENRWPESQPNMSEDWNILWRQNFKNMKEELKKKIF